MSSLVSVLDVAIFKSLLSSSPIKNIFFLLLFSSFHQSQRPSSFLSYGIRINTPLPTSVPSNGRLLWWCLFFLLFSSSFKAKEDKKKMQRIMPFYLDYTYAMHAIQEEPISFDGWTRVVDKSEELLRSTLKIHFKTWRHKRERRDTQTLTANHLKNCFVIFVSSGLQQFPFGLD